MKKRKTFEEWMKDVDSFISKETGLTHLDLEDCTYFDWYEDEIPAKTAAKRALKNAGATWL